MFAELIFASLIATGGVPEAQAQTPRAQHAVTRDSAEDAGRADDARLHLAADLGGPYYPDQRRGHHDRGYSDYSSPRHSNHPYHQGRRDDQYYPGSDHGRYSDRSGDPYYGENNRSGDYRGDYRTGRQRPGDSLIDPEGRPYPYAGQPTRPDVPAYRSGAYDRPGAYDGTGRQRGFEQHRNPYDDTRRDPFSGQSRFDPRPPEQERYRRSPAPYYQPSSYHGPVYKKKATEHIGIILKPSRTVDSDAGLTV